LEIIKTNYGYKLIENKKISIIKKFISLIILLLFGCSIYFIDIKSIQFPIEIIIKIIISIIVIYEIYYTLLHDTSVKIYKDKIYFCIDLKPFKPETIKLKYFDIKEISINYEMDYEEGGGEVYYYNLDIIDKDFNAYRLAQSENYELIYDYGIEIEKILKIKLDDRNDIEGYGNIYKKRIV
jgi:hypothetical protein